MRPRSARQPHGSEEFQGEAVGPIVIGERFELAAACGAGVIDHQVDVPGLLYREGREAGGGIRLPKIERQHLRRASGGFDHCADFVQRRRVAGTQHHACAFSR